MLLEIIQHMDIVRTHMRGLRELCITGEMTGTSSGKVICQYRIIHDKDWFSCTAGLCSMRGGLFSLLLHACMKLEK